MKEIGIIEKNYYVIQTTPRKFNIEFRVGEHKVSIEKFEWYERMSEETNCFVGDLILDGTKVGACSNEGRGGCANYNAYGNWDLSAEIEREISKIENYCFPSMRLNMYEVIDNIACFLITFKESKVNTVAKAKAIINVLNKEADKYRSQFSK